MSARSRAIFAIATRYWYDCLQRLAAFEADSRSASALSASWANAGRPVAPIAAAAAAPAPTRARNDRRPRPAAGAVVASASRFVGAGRVESGVFEAVLMTCKFTSGGEALGR